MALVVARVTVAQAATIINIIIAFLQYTVGLSLIALFIYFLPPINPAVAWNVIGRKLHSSLWPTLLRSDTLKGAGGRVALFSMLSFVTTILVAVSGVIMPLGLSDGLDMCAPVRTVSATFVQDTSPLGLATSPRLDYLYGRICGAFSMVVCPGGAVNTTVIPQVIVDKFNSTPYGPFSMQFRRYYNGTSGRNWTTSVPIVATTQSLILRTGIFAVGGLVVDFDNPGVGLWNHTLPVNLKRGATWAEDLIWLEPVSACTDTNLTIDYTLQNHNDVIQVNDFNLTDRGGFYNLTHDYPILDRDGQNNLDLQHHAYKGAVLSNFYTMMKLNLTRNASYAGRVSPLSWTKTNFFPGKSQPIPLLYLGQITTPDNITVTRSDVQTACEGYGGQDIANISNVAVKCAMFLGPPQRTDGGDERVPADGSTWTQRMFTCAGSTRARMQRVEFSYNGTRELGAINIRRSNINTPVLWGMEKADLKITDVDLLWGRVADGSESDSDLWTVRSDVFYVPAGSADVWGLTTGGLPSVMPGITWAQISGVVGVSQVVDYSGLSNYALLHKYQELMQADPTNGVKQIRALMWTDVMANNLVGTASRTELQVTEHVPSVAYDLRYAIPALLLCIIWLPAVLSAVFVLLTGLLKISYLKYLLAHTSAGRIALGDSALRPMNMSVMQTTSKARGDEVEWADGPGRTPVWMEAAGEHDYEQKGIFSAVSTRDQY
ncbi:hypothetical protein MIND_00943900 [Mycena indigotica]|uniref:Uncharacterized protein n=1 Tax=Mycena indigotica TaxID=2126181 RepID=A0A8H6SCP0_9AGAR|nr:uncharacterized protein MIND_00943900 [Mycena indigotica]KAF7297110.1 hypothetical protein MIND_00943900 [Mycena indigotica]